jgi:hypothetical protein
LLLQNILSFIDAFIQDIYVIGRTNFSITLYACYLFLCKFCTYIICTRGHERIFGSSRCLDKLFLKLFGY